MLSKDIFHGKNKSKNPIHKVLHGYFWALTANVYMMIKRITQAKHLQRST